VVYTTALKVHFVDLVNTFAAALIAL